MLNLNGDEFLFIFVVLPLFGFLLYVFTCSFIARYSKNPYWCKAWGWHDSKNMRITSATGINLESTCPRCGKDCIMDSQGNWF